MSSYTKQQLIEAMMNEWESIRLEVGEIDRQEEQDLRKDYEAMSIDVLEKEIRESIEVGGYHPGIKDYIWHWQKENVNATEM